MSASVARIFSPVGRRWIHNIILLSLFLLTCGGGGSSGSSCISVRGSHNRSYGFVSRVPHLGSQRQTCLNSGAIAGIQPSGDIHVGNYIGCIHPALQYQNDKGGLTFMIADLHATTVPQQKGRLSDITKKTVATLLACGIDPQKTSMILQSEFPSILELQWILGTVISLGRLRKLANFERREIARDTDSVGTCLYPLLMAADVLGSGSDVVIAGPDQECHLSLIREVAEKLNRHLSEDVVRLPRLDKSHGFRVLSLDGVGKMSKSNEKENTRVSLLDSDDMIAEKLRSAKTSTSRDPASPEVKNLFRLYSFFSNESYSDVSNNAESFQFSAMKDKLHRAMSSHLGHIRSRYEDIIKNEEILCRALSDGRSRMQPVFEGIVERIKRHSHYYITKQT